MNPEEDKVGQAQEQNDESVYEAPKIESAMTPSDLAREVAYAGVTDVTLPEG